VDFLQRGVACLDWAWVDYVAVGAGAKGRVAGAVQAKTVEVGLQAMAV
jgi:hypothetical protein